MRYRAAFAASALVLTGWLACPDVARADDEVLHVFEGIGVAGAIVGDVVFTTYDVATASKGDQPEKGWMIAQTAVAAPQTVVAYIVIVADSQNPDFEARAPLALPLGVAASSLATHSIWSVATDRFPPAPRLGASWLIGSNLTFTALSLSETFSGKLLPKSLALVQSLVMTPEAVICAVEAVNDPQGRGGWIGLAGWSGVLATHGVLSFLVGVANVQPPPKAPPRPLHPPPPEEEEPSDKSPDGRPSPGEPTPADPPPEEPEAPPKQQGHAPVVVPAAISDGFRVVPGALVVGVF